MPDILAQVLVHFFGCGKKRKGKLAFLLVDRNGENDLTPQERKAKENRGVDFFARMALLTATGVIEWVPHLAESDSAEAELIHPLMINGNEDDGLENRLGRAAHFAGWYMLTEGQRQWASSKQLWLVPVARHLTGVQVVGIARMRYRPHTSMTAAWWANLQSSGEHWIEFYSKLIERARVAEAS